MSLFESRDYYKPFRYPWAYQAYKTMRAMAWEPHEAPMMDDIKDWQKKLTKTEREFLTQLFRFFTQADIDVASGYIDHYLPRFKHTELRMMMTCFADAEANHIDAYSTLMETLGISEGEYKAFMNYKAMREKHEYMNTREGRSISDLAVDIACFSAFGEGMQLFSSFALLMNFQRRGLMKGMTTIIEWSIRDESHHVESMIKLFHTLVEEHPRVWNDETKKRVYDTCRAMVKLEDAFIDQAFAFGPVEGVTPEETKRYIRYIADRRLLQLGLKPNYRQKENPFPWLDWIMNAPTHTNFFEQRSTEYSKAEIEGEAEGWDFLKTERSLAHDLESFQAQYQTQWPPNLERTHFALGPMEYRVYTKPGCPHCDRAKGLLDMAGKNYEAIELPEAEDRQKLFRDIAINYGRTGWNTSPMIFELDEDGFVERFIGGADDLANHLASKA